MKSRGFSQAIYDELLRLYERRTEPEAAKRENTETKSDLSRFLVGGGGAAKPKAKPTECLMGTRVHRSVRA